MCFYNDIYKITILVEKWGFLEIRFLIRFSDSTLMSIKYIFSTYLFLLIFSTYLFTRKKFSKSRFWDKLSTEDKATIKTGCLESVQNEQEKSGDDTTLISFKLTF